jgi:transcriptional regulator with XRE-family HTH domain
MSRKFDHRALAARIARLRDATGLPKVFFAKGLEVTSVAVVHWETGRSEPSAAAYIKLGRLALENLPSAAPWFFHQAGLDVATLRRLVPEISKSLDEYEKNTFEPRADAKAVSLPLVSDSLFQGKPSEVVAEFNPLALKISGHIESYVTLPSEVVPHPGATLAVRAPDDYMRFIFRKGDLLVIEIGPPPFLPSWAQRFNYAPVVAAYHQRINPTDAEFRQGLHLRRMRRHLDYIYLETEVGRNAAVSRVFSPESRVDEREEFSPESVQVEGSSEWIILGTAVVWLGSNLDPAREEALRRTQMSDQFRGQKGDE